MSDAERIAQLEARLAALESQSRQALDYGAGHGIEHDANGRDPTTTRWATTTDLADVAAVEAAGTVITVPRGDHVHGHAAAAHSLATTAEIADVVFDGVFRRQDRRDPALSIVRVGLFQVPFSDQSDGTLAGGFEGKREPGDPAADDENLRFRHG